MAAVAQFKVLAATHTEKAPADQHKKDKLEETKKRDRERKEAFKAERDAQKDAKHQEEAEEKEAVKFDRQFHGTSKQAAHEARVAAKHEKKAAEGQMCEHGVWKCKICFPHAQHK